MPINRGIESSMSIWHFQQHPESKPEEHIRIFTSTSGRTLLIEEDVPNDCGPCWNHVLVRFEEDELSATYLEIPERVTPKTEVFGHTPRVLKITDEQMTYGYADGTRVSEPFDKRIKTDQRPKPPG